MASNLPLYDSSSVRAFLDYFHKPRRKRGRPKKKKKARAIVNLCTPPKKQKQSFVTNKKNVCNVADAVDLTVKQKEGLVATLEGAVAGVHKINNLTRVNWDTEENAKYRERVASSWLAKNDLYSNPKWSMRRYCVSTGIDRNVLNRYLQQKRGIEQHAGHTKCSLRGRPTLLPENVMRHICEGA